MSYDEEYAISENVPGSPVALSRSTCEMHHYSSLERITFIHPLVQYCKCRMTKSTPPRKTFLVRGACRPVSRLCIRPSYNFSDLISYAGFLIERFVVQLLSYNAIYGMKKAISTLQCFVYLLLPNICRCGTYSPIDLISKYQIFIYLSA
ncbi:hypothetical protein AVEN_4677-1 [Araneus ventricosus]|uniref:Uncharacterized protein n=1 Tax=Araneus ventricosus TaxID=182803 RepID=A0A4Y2LKS6_ARAVE|nr:hypothetical protein AVEN_4677-1 [Araneus ventricosus]